MSIENESFVILQSRDIRVRRVCTNAMKALITKRIKFSPSYLSRSDETSRSLQTPILS